MPDLDPLGNPVGFWAVFGVLAIIVILLAAGPLFFVLSLLRSSRGRVDPEQAALSKKFDHVEVEQHRLEEELKKMRARRPPPPPG